MKGLRRINLALGVLAALAPVAHVLELANKLSLDGPLWLAVQQNLYRGWGPFWGGPTEIGALATSLALAYGRRRRNEVLTVVAAAGYAGMLAAYFVLNRPVNAAISAWTAATLPPDWPAYRARWEAGHGIAALLAVISLAALIRAAAREGRERMAGD